MERRRDDPPAFGSLPVAGYKIVGIEFWGCLLYLTAESPEHGDAGRVRLHISGTFPLVSPTGGEVTLDPEGARSSAVLSLRYALIDLIRIDEDSKLLLRPSS